MSLDTVIAELKSVLDPSGMLVGEQVTARQAGIWRTDSVSAAAICRPATTAGVADVLKICNAAHQPVVTHGGLTGLAEGAIATADDIVLSTERLTQIERVDTADRTLHAQAGVTLQSAQERAKEHGLMLALDLGARGSCTLGGNAATNAGGHQVIRYGMARDSILGLEVVLADGTVLDAMNSMLKNNAGYDLKHLFIGSEGTLGVITRLVMRLRPASRTQETALIACRDFSQIIALLNRFDLQLGGTLSAFEVMWQDYFSVVARQGAPLPDHYPYYVLVEMLGSDPGSDFDRFVRAIEAAEKASELAEVVVAKSGAERDSLWALRDQVESTLEIGPAQVFDVSLPLSAMAGYVEEVRARLDKYVPGHSTFVFGHAGDGNLHLICALENKTSEQHAVIERAVYEPLQALRGSVSGEHGIGLEKKSWLPISRTMPEIKLMQQLKRTLDPHGILNPGKIFDV